MTNRGLRCPLNGAGLKIITRGGQVEEMEAFVSRVVNNQLRGQMKSKDALHNYARNLMKGKNPKGLTIEWDDLMVELLDAKWIEGATLPDSVKKSIRKKSDEIEAEKKKAANPVSKNDKGHGKHIGMSKLAALQAKLKAGDLSAGGAGAGAEEEVEAKDPQADRKKAAFDAALKKLLSVLSKDLGGKVSMSELSKVSFMGNVNPKIRFLAEPGEYSDILNDRFGKKYEVGELERITMILKKVVELRKQESAKKDKAKKQKPKQEKAAAQPVRNDKRAEFDNVLKTCLGVLSKELGGKVTISELTKASPMGQINPRIRFLLKPGEYSDLLNSEFGPGLEVSELRRIAITLKKVVQIRKNSPRLAPRDSPKIPKIDKPTVCVVTRNADVIKKRSKALGLKLSDKTIQKLLGTKCTGTKFEDDKALIEVDGEKIWIPDSEVLIKLGAPKSPAQRKPSSDGMKPLKRAPESPRSDKSVRSLEERIRSLERDLVVAEKQKEIYKHELAKLKATSGKASPQSAPIDKNAISLISSAEFEQKVKNYPNSASKALIVPSGSTKGMEKVNIFVYLDDDSKPAVSFETSHPDANLAKDLACTIALNYLQKHAAYRRHFKN